MNNRRWKTKKEKRNRKIKITAAVLLIFLVIFAAFFFANRITAIEIEGNEYYTDDEIKDLSYEEMDALRVCIINEKNEIASKVNMMSAEEQKQHPELFERYNTLSSKFMSLNDVYWFKRGKVKLVLPDDEKELKPISFGDEIKLRLKNAFNRKNNK